MEDKKNSQKSLNEMSPSSINLSSFKLRSNLEERFWKDKKLDSRIRLHLLDIADDFWDYVGISWVEPEQILLVGSICSYNWSRYSDVDLHILVDFSKVHKKKEFVQSYFDDKKIMWNEHHKNLKIFGYNIELYVQDIDADNTSNGIYDLEKDEWVKEPERSVLKPIGCKRDYIKSTSAKFITQIEKLQEKYKTEKDSHKLDELSKECETLFDKLKLMRKSSLKDGEMAPGNIIWKVLRRTKFLDILLDLRDKLYDKCESIKESQEYKDKLLKKY